MRAEPQGDTILLSWNRNSPALQSTAEGVLKIDDGPQHRRMALDRAELATGLILYKPVSSEVVFRLELGEKEGQRIVENLKVVGTSDASGNLESKTQPNAPEAGKDWSERAIPNQHGSKERNYRKGRFPIGESAVAQARCGCIPGTTIICPAVRRSTETSIASDRQR